MRVEIKHYFHQGNGIPLDPSVDKGNPLRSFKESFQERTTKNVTNSDFFFFFTSWFFYFSFIMN